MRKGAITREQYWILRMLSERGPMKIKDLASTIGCTAGSASVAVKRLERAGLAKRERSEKDERVVTVILEKKGVKSLQAWGTEQLNSMTTIFSSLSAEERRTLRTLLAKALTAGGDLPIASTVSTTGRKA